MKWLGVALCVVAFPAVAQVTVTDGDSLREPQRLASRLEPNGRPGYRVKAWRWPNEDGQYRPYFQPVFHTTWYAADFPSEDAPEVRNPVPLALEMADMFWINPWTGKLERRPK